MESLEISRSMADMEIAGRGWLGLIFKRGIFQPRTSVVNYGSFEPIGDRRS